MEFQKLSSEVSSGGFIDVGVEVGGDIFFHGGQILGNLAKKFFDEQLERRLIGREKKKHCLWTYERRCEGGQRGFSPQDVRQ